MKYLIAMLAALGISAASAQTIETTPNLITSGSGHTWSGVTTGTLPSNYMPGGPTPIYDPNTNTISFSYNANAYVGQVIAINQALAHAGAGVKINGYNYSYDIRNMNGDDRQGGIDSITVAQVLRGANNSSLLSSSQFYNTKFDWQTITGTRTASTPIDIASATYLQIGITGGDNGYWAGYFGPQIRNVSMSLNYSIDPCATNPAYSPTCPGYNSLHWSNNLIPDSNAYAVSGGSLTQSYAINQALTLAGAGAIIHGFQWGYVANANGPYCASWDMGFLGCWDHRNPSIATNVTITDNNGNSLYSVNRNYQNSYNTTSYQYLFPSSRSIATLGNFNFSASTVDQAYVGSVWSRSVYTPDPCVVDPLSSTSCPGYAQAYFNQQCTANPLYDSQCPGYAQAYLNQQCTANPLYSQACPGYAVAFLNLQCSQNPLYSTACVGYTTAYNDCSNNPLSHNFCPAYQTAVTQCAASPLYAAFCPGHSTAVNECAANPLSYNYCPGYQTATTECNNNPLSYNYCPSYQTATASCAANTLYANYCPGYQFALSCSLDGLYSRDCPNYADAYAKKNVLGIGTVTTTAVPSTTTTIVLAQASSDPVAQAAPVVADPIVNNAVTSRSTTTTAETNPAAPVRVTAASQPAATATATSSADNNKQEKKTETAATKTEEKAADKPKTAREQLAEQRREAAKREAVTRGKELANDMGKAADMAAQVEVQNVVIQAMGFTPGFDAYNAAKLPDGMLYPPVQAYRDQRTIDNAHAERFLNGSSEVRHQMMIEQQYNLGK